MGRIKKASGCSRGDKLWLAKISEAQDLLVEEQRAEEVAQRSSADATVYAFRLGRLLCELPRGYGAKTIPNFAEDSGIKDGTLRDRIYLYRGCVAEGHIRRWPHMIPDYYKALGSSINGFFPRKRDDGRHWVVDLLIHSLLLTNPPLKTVGDRSVANVEAVKEAVKLLEDFHARVRSSKRLSRVLAGITLRWVRGKDGYHYEPSYPSPDSMEDGDVPGFVIEIHRLLSNVLAVGGDSSQLRNPEKFHELFGVPFPDDFVHPEDGMKLRAGEVIEKDDRRRFLKSSKDLSSPQTEGVVKQRLFSGNCLKVLADRRLFPARSVDVVVTDPPYSQEYYGYVAWRKHTEVEHDAEETISGQARLIGKVAKMLVENAIIKEQFIWFHFFPMDFAHLFVPPVLEVFEKEYEGRKDWVIHQILAWNKVTGTKVDNFRFMRRDVEGILYVNVGRKQLSETEGGKDYRLHSTLLTCPVRDRGMEDNENRFFWKPIPLLQRLIGLATHEDDNLEANAQVVLDPFAGSGSTGVAAIRCKRDYKLIESHAGQFATAEANILKELGGKTRPNIPKSVKADGKACPWRNRCVGRDEG
jgi:DNA modification methylase